jgi:hypothetical protein
VLISDVTEVNYAEPVISFGKDLEGARLESWPERRISHYFESQR